MLKRILLKNWSVERLRTPVFAFYWLLAAYLFYIWSLGPVLWLCRVKIGTSWEGLPRVVQVVYAPVPAITPGPVGDAMDSYLEFWMSLTGENPR
jgi:hypothetical protein